MSNLSESVRELLYPNPVRLLFVLFGTLAYVVSSVIVSELDLSAQASLLYGMFVGAFWLFTYAIVPREVSDDA